MFLIYSVDFVRFRCVYVLWGCLLFCCCVRCCFFTSTYVVAT